MLQINKALARTLSAFGLAAIVGLVAGCGGGGGSSSTASTTSSSGSTSGTTSGSTSGSSSIVASGPVSSTPASLATNQVAVLVSSAMGAANIPMVSVTVCQHGTSVCQTINNIQLDTGSSGLRLTSSALNSTMLNALPVETVSGQAVAECMGFADGSSWGSVRLADVKIGGESATATSGMPVHILGDIAQSAAGGSNNACASPTTLHDTPFSLAANGILGIGTAKYDCGTVCQVTTNNDLYYGCTLSGGTMSNCTDLAVPNTQQVANPVQFFASANTNGVILNMPTVGASGAISASGYLTFGLGTQANNAVPSSGIQTFTTDHYGDVKSASLSGTTYSDTSSTQRAAFFDTGSNGIFFPNTPGLAACSDGSGFYCPVSAVPLQPSVTGFNGTTASLAINIENWLNLRNGGGFAFSNLGGDSGLLAVDFGMPFFYGRTVYFNYDTANSGTLNVGTTAYVAF
ncbi:DUF3443 family protein [Trinickia sp. Y13]|uniref:DUF3443 family protein n=1 Tax=Trinickia sp. Y13 TaxID=2917807 RepID=UPI0024050F0A|nr:DUF3443 family protein [Trinickia sp. Y13]MDG0026844.1 DUF3443 domain-containing protein [Trinickia sp. Y13]